MKKKSKLSFAAIFVVLLAIVAVVPALAGRPAHSVHVGGPDSCEAWAAAFDIDVSTGCDGNFSLVAIQHEDGAVTGHLTDAIRGPGGVHAVLDCLVVDGNQAWVSGTVTKGEYAGLPVSVRVVDNGTSANDPPDQITFSNIGDPYYRVCTEMAGDDEWHELYDVPQGQVRID